MKNQIHATITRQSLLAILLGCGIAMQSQADPQLTSWFTNSSGKYARIYQTTSNMLAGSSVTTWTRNAATQSLPAYSGVQEVDFSTSWVYLRTTGLGFHVMGPWYLDAAKTQDFPTFPTNQKLIYRIPRVPAVPTTKTLNSGGSIGIFVDGVAMFNSWDANTWNGTTETTGGGSAGSAGSWNRDAFVNEGLSFDPANAHQPQNYQYHYHANPPALRFLMGDSVAYNSASNSYSEVQTNHHHSPILGWVADGYPIYGPYGYSSATNTNSAIRRMISGYVLRNGSNGTTNLTTAGRGTLPAWALRAYGRTNPLSGTNVGPAVSTSYPLGRYMEDNDYLGDLGKTQGTDFDLDSYNGRFCVTPEYPGGTYAYFVAIAADGTPVFPYNIGIQYYGTAAGGAVTTVTETVTTNYSGGPNAPLKLSSPKLSNNVVTLAWSATEGGTYQVLASTNLSTWTTNSSAVAAVANTGTSSFSSVDPQKFFRVVRTNLASYDPVSGSSSGSTGGNGIVSVSPTNGARGSTFTLTLNLDASANPAPPPQTAPIISVALGSIAGSSNTHVSTTQVTSSITIPANATTGAQTVTLVFPGPPATPTNYVTYTLTSGFTIQ